MKVQRQPVRATLVAAAACGALLLAGCSSEAAAQSSDTKSGPTRSITTSATGTAEGVPDQITAVVAIANGGPSAAQVLADNSERTQRLLDELKIGGIDAKDVSTTAVTLGPTYDKKGNISGYQASNQLTITLRNLDTAGAQLDKLVQAGGDRARIEGISLGFQDDDELLTEARTDAVRRARAQAEEMADAGGAKLGRVRTITDSTPVQPYAESTRTAYDAAAVSVPISPGSQDLNVQVKVVFELET